MLNFMKLNKQKKKIVAESAVEKNFIQINCKIKKEWKNLWAIQSSSHKSSKEFKKWKEKNKQIFL